MFVMVVMGMSPHTGRAKHQKTVKLQYRGGEPRLAQYSAMIKIVINNEQTDNNESAYTTTNDPQNHREKVSASNRQTDGVTCNGRQ